MQSEKIITLELNDDDALRFQFCIFNFTAMQNIMNEFASNDIFEYNEENYNRLLSSYIEKYKEIQMLIISFLEKNNYENIKLTNYGYNYSQNTLIITYI
jgi:hypothetical protein